MKIICNTARLNEACQNVQRAVSSKATMPAIEGILMKAEAGQIALTGYDMDMGITTVQEARVEEDGAIVLNARLLCDILRRLPGETVSIEADPRQLCTIRCGEVEYQLVGIAAEEYPELPTVTEEVPVLIDSETLEKMVKQTIFAVSTNDTKVVHTGIKFEVSENTLKLIAVDGFRLAIRTEAINYTGEPLSFVVPAKTLSEVIKLIDEADVVALKVAARHIVFEVGAYALISRLLDGEFLDYNAAIPKAFTTEVEVDTKTIISAIDRMSLMISDRVKSPLRCVFDENVIRMSTSTTIGAANDKVPAKIEGNRVEIGFNNRFLLDAFRACDLETVKVTLNGPLSPITVVPAEGDSFLFLVLPVRLRNEK
ncbi:MAG: DNA polymerase III subunit beta [Clostridia bacterium]|nr:DNA polymerase III subunit beta [Clostridia bacterium]